MDALLNPLEEARFLKRNDNFVKQIYKQVHFSVSEIRSLLIMYYKLQKQNQYSYEQKGVTKAQFLEVLHKTLKMTDMTLNTMILVALDKKARERYISKETWLKSLSLLLRGTMEENIQFCFSVYDSHDSGSLGKESIYKLMKFSLLSTSGDADAEESVRDLVDVVLKRIDLDRDGKISFNDYRTSVLNQPCWLEFLGPCLPDRNAAYTFLITLTNQARY